MKHLVLCVSIATALVLECAYGQKTATPQPPVTQGAGLRAADEGGDPDLPLIGRGSIDRSEYLRLRSEHIARLRGIPYPEAANPRIRAIRNLEEQLKSQPRQAMAVVPSWVPLGPAPIPNGQTEGISLPVSGRITAIAIHPTHPDTAYIGTAQGGVYRTLNGGSSWTPLFDNALSLAVGAIAIDPLNATTLFVGTGEGNLSLDCFFGVGVYIIKNADTSPLLSGPFNLDGSSNNVLGVRAINRILFDPADDNIVFVATTTGYSGSGGIPYPTPPPRGLYRSINAMSGSPTFTRLEMGAGSNTLITDAVLEPGNPNNLICAVYGQAALGSIGGIYRSTNALAATPAFSQRLALSDGLNVKFDIRKYGSVAVVLAATAESNGALRKSRDGGQTWSAPFSAANGFCYPQCSYDIVLGLDPVDSNTVYIGGSAAGYAANTSELKKSTNGGTTFVDTYTGLHADMHAIAIASPPRNNVIYVGNDGGVFRSTTSGSSWNSLNTTGLSATQFESIALHPTDRYFTIGGTQDNGTPLLKPDASWFQADYGDGGFSAIDQNATNTTAVTMYHTYYNSPGSLIGYARVLTSPCATKGQWTYHGIYSGSIDPSVYCDGTHDVFNGISLTDNVLFYAPLALGPGNPNTVYFGTDRLYRSANKGDTMFVVSQAPLAGGIPISAIGISPQNDNVRIVGLSDGEVYATTTGSSTLTNVTGSIPPYYVARAVIDPHNTNAAYVTLDGYGTIALPVQHIWKTTNIAGGSWAAASNGLPDVPVNAFVIDPQNSNELYCGTDIGVYHSSDAGANWSAYGTGLPRVAVFDMAIQSPSRLLRIATHGRGLWEIATSLSGPNLAVSPDSLSVTVTRGDTTTRTLAIGNTGALNLNWTILASSPGAPAAMPQALPDAAAGPSGSISKGSRDPGSAPAVPMGATAFGDSWIDSDQPNGPVYGWVDVTGTGTQVSTWRGNADDGYVVVGLPFSFPFYGVNYGALKICTNGWLSFDTASTSAQFINTSVPSVSQPNNALFAWWTDLILTSGTVHYYYDAANTRFIVQYTNVPHIGSGGPYTFEIILKPGGDILYQYNTMTAPLNIATIGLENGSGTAGSQVVFNNTYVHNGLAVLLKPSLSWFSLNPGSGTTVPGSSQNVTVKFKPGASTAGDERGNLIIFSNDSAHAQKLVSLHLRVLDPAITASPDSIVGKVAVGDSTIRTLTIGNTGAGVLHWKIPVLANPTMSAAEGRASVERTAAGLRASARVAEATGRPSGLSGPIGEVTQKAGLALTLAGTGRGEGRNTEEVAAVAYPASVASTILNIALVHGESSNADPKVLDVQNKLLATGRFSSITLIAAGSVTPATSQLLTYDAVMVWDNFAFADRVTLGNNLADYVDAGGGVVITLFAGDSSSPAGSSLVLKGRFNSGGYFAISPGSDLRNTALTLGTVYQSSHPLLSGVTSFNGGSGSFHTNSPLSAGAVRIADWSDGQPLIAEKLISGHRRIDLNFYPSSSDALSSGWQSSTDGAKIMANALVYVSQPSFVSASPDSGTVAPGASQTIQVKLNAKNLAAGDFRQFIPVTSNDTGHPVKAVPAHLSVVPPPLSGMKTVGTGGDYLTLKQAFDAINLSGLDDTLTLLLKNTLYNEPPLLLTNNARSDVALFIRPLNAADTPRVFITIPDSLSAFGFSIESFRNINIRQTKWDADTAMGLEACLWVDGVCGDLLLDHVSISNLYGAGIEIASDSTDMAVRNSRISNVSTIIDGFTTGLLTLTHNTLETKDVGFMVGPTGNATIQIDSNRIIGDSANDVGDISGDLSGRFSFRADTITGFGGMFSMEINHHAISSNAPRVAGRQSTKSALEQLRAWKKDVRSRSALLKSGSTNNHSAPRRKGHLTMHQAVSKTNARTGLTVAPPVEISDNRIDLSYPDLFWVIGAEETSILMQRNHVTGHTGGGGEIDLSTDDTTKTATVGSNVFDGPSIGKFLFTANGGPFVFDQNVFHGSGHDNDGVELDLTVDSARITNNHASGFYTAMTISLDAPVTNISGNLCDSDAVGFVLIVSNPGPGSTVEFGNNISRNNLDVGLEVSQDGGPPCPLEIIQNTFTHNGTAGILVDQSWSARNRAATPRIRRNNIFGNGQYDLWNDDSARVDAEENYWGASTTLLMNAGPYPKDIPKIRDHFDSAGTGFVDYSRWAQDSIGGNKAAIEGRVIVDANSDCQAESTEHGAGGRLIHLMPLDLFATTSDSGYFYFPSLPSGSYTLDLEPKQYWLQTCPPSNGVISLTLASAQIWGGVLFGTNQAPSSQDLRVNVNAGVARPGFDQTYGIFYENKGAGPVTATLTFVHPATTTFLPASAFPPPTSYSAGTRTVTWNLGLLPPGGYHQVKLTLHLAPPPAVNIGDVITATAAIVPTAGDLTPDDNTSTCLTVVRGSADPNDKQVLPAGYGAFGDVPVGTVLNYQIRFQNVGTDTAFTVVVRDTLTPAVDIATFAAGAASAPYLVNVSGNHVVEWTLTNIDLPESTVNEPGSRGFVNFSIRPKATDPIGAVITNRAGVYFDYNLPVVTNTVSNRVGPNSIAMSVPVQANWNLISLPVTVADDTAAHLFQHATAGPFAYVPGSGYQTTPTVNSGGGYWLRFGNAQPISYTGAQLGLQSFPVSAGWNIIGSSSDPMPVTDITSSPPGIRTSRFFGYAGKYSVSDTIHPGSGYWVKVSQDGTLYFLTGSSQAPVILPEANGKIVIVPADDIPPPPPGVGVANDKFPLPARFALEQNYPNPFNPVTVIRYELPGSAGQSGVPSYRVSLRIYDVLGQVVATLVEGMQEAGYRSASWDASGMPSGMYVYKLEATSAAEGMNTFTQVKKMLLLR